MIHENFYMHPVSYIPHLLSRILLIFIRVYLVNSWLITLKLSHQNHRKPGAHGRTRTRAPQLGRLMLKPTELLPPVSIAGYRLRIAESKHVLSVAKELNPKSKIRNPNLSGGEGRIRTSEGFRRQIYSLLPLSTRPPPLA